jgi:hypothetical protein
MLAEQLLSALAVPFPLIFDSPGVIRTAGERLRRSTFTS